MVVAQIPRLLRASLTYPALVGDQIRTEWCQDRTWDSILVVIKQFGP